MNDRVKQATKNKKLKNMKTLVKYTSWIAVIISAVFFFNNLKSFALNPFEGTDLYMVNAAKADADGYVYIIDNGSARIIKTNPSGKMEYMIESGKSFQYAIDIAIDDSSTFYIHDVVWDTDGLSIISERILSFSKKTGRLQKIVFEHIYNKRQAFPSIKDIQLLSGQLWFAKADENGFEIGYINEHDEAQTYHYEIYPDASLVLQDFSITENEIYILDKAGKIITLDNGELSTVYTAVSGNDITRFMLPYNISKSEFLYFTDIGQRSIGYIDEDGRHDFIAPDLSVNYSERTIYYSVYASRDTIMFTDEECVYFSDTDGEILSEMRFVEPGTGLIALRISILTALLVFVFPLIYRIVKAVHGIFTKKLTQEQQLTLVIVLASLLISVFIIPSITSSFKAESKKEIINRLSTLVYLSQEILDSEAIENIKNPQDYGNEYYQRLIISLRNMLDVRYDWNSNIYCDVYKYQGNDLYSIAYLDGSMGAFYSYGSVLKDSDLEAIINSGGEFVMNDNIVDISGSYMAVTGPIYSHDGNIIGGIEIGMDLKAFNSMIADQIKQLTVNIILIIAILIFVMIEAVDAILTFAASKKIKKEFKNHLLPVPYIRSLSFIIYIAFNLATGFIPIYTGRFKAELWGISPALCATLPLTVNQVLIAVSSLLCGRLMRGIGMKKVFVIGSIFCVTGEIMIAVSASFTSFMAGMALSGFGAGLVFSFMNIYIASLDNIEHKAKGFSLYNSAGFSGMNCGVLIGAALAVMIGQAQVFYVTAAVWFVSLCCFGVLIHNKSINRPVSVENRIGLMQFIISKRVFMFLVLFFVYTTLNGFLFYFVPIFCADIGLRETDISLMFIMHTISITFVGPLIAKKLESNNISHTNVLSTAMLLSIVSLLTAAYRPEIIFIAAAVFILGCSNSIGFIYYPLFFSEIDETKTYGTDNSMSIYGTVENIGGAAAPFVFGWAITAGIGMGFVAITAVSVVVMFMFNIISLRSKREHPA